MVDFFYDSLETLKKLKKPTNKEVGQTALIILVVVVLSALIFILYDTVFKTLYTTFYEMMTAG